MSVISGIFQASATRSASNAQESATNKASELSLQGQREAIAAAEKALERQIELNEPFRQSGLVALPKLIEEIIAGAPTFDEFVASPEAAAIREQELKDMSVATERSAAAKGNLFAPATQQALQDKALQKTRASKLGQYDNALAIRESDLTRKTDLVNIGRGASTSQAAAVGQTGANVSNVIANTSGQLQNLATEAGAARASGYINQGNIIKSASNSAVEGVAVAKYLEWI